MKNKALVVLAAATGLLFIGNTQASASETPWSNERDGKTFIEIALGATSIKNNANDSMITSTALDKESNIAEISFGHYLTENIFTKANFQTSIYDIYSITNIGINASYQLNYGFFNPYIGFDLGYSTLEWDNSPVLDPINQVGNSQSSYVGISGGIEYTIDDDFLITSEVQYIIYDHETNINNGLLKQESQVNFFVGVKYVL